MVRPRRGVGRRARPGGAGGQRSCSRVAAAVGATRIPTDAGVGTLVDTDTATYRATQQVRDAFGEEPVVVLAKGDLQRADPDLEHLPPAAARGLPLRARCRRGRSRSPGPAPNWPSSTRSSSSPARRPSSTRRWSRSTPSCGGWRSACRRDQLREFLLAVATRYGITSAPSLDNAEFVATVVFDLAPRPRHAEGAARLPLPQQPLGPDRRPPEAGPQRSRTPPRARA